GSASEFIHRISAHAWRSGLRQVVLPVHSYGDYEQAARVWGLDCVRQVRAQPALHWACEPSSPLGQSDPALAQWQADARLPARALLRGASDPSTVRPEPVEGLSTQSHPQRNDSSLYVLDCAYRPLRLDGQAGVFPPGVWQVWT